MQHMLQQNLSQQYAVFYALGFRDTACLKSTEEKYKGHLLHRKDKLPTCLMSSDYR